MKLLTVRQPWASAMFVSPIPLVPPKSIENRVWPVPSKFRERIGIHAGLTVDRFASIPPLENPDLGRVLGTVEITGCHEANSQQCVWHECRENPWAQWPDRQHPVVFHWELEHPREFVTPIRAKGLQKLWDPTDSVRHLMSIADFRVDS